MSPLHHKIFEDYYQWYLGKDIKCDVLLDIIDTKENTKKFLQNNLKSVQGYQYRGRALPVYRHVQ
jgi:hypothetical protein